MTILNEEELIPEHIFITSLFTYWSSYVKEAVHFIKRNIQKLL